MVSVPGNSSVRQLLRLKPTAARAYQPRLLVNPCRCKLPTNLHVYLRPTKRAAAERTAAATRAAADDHFPHIAARNNYSSEYSGPL